MFCFPSGGLSSIYFDELPNTFTQSCLRFTFVLVVRILGHGALSIRRSATTLFSKKRLSFSVEYGVPHVSPFGTALLFRGQITTSLIRNIVTVCTITLHPNVRYIPGQSVGSIE